MKPNNNFLSDALTGQEHHYEFGEPDSLFDIVDIAMRRPRVEWATVGGDVEDVGVRLAFGTGYKKVDGWKSVDYPDWDAEKMEPLPFADGSVADVMCLHTLDHLSAPAVMYWLLDMQRVLAPGGTITIVVPHHMSTLAYECIEHKTRYGLKTWRNILSNPAYEIVDVPGGAPDWRLEVGFNMVMGFEERNLVLVTQLHKV